MTTTSPLVEMRDIEIGFPGVKALDGVSFRLFPGEIHSLMGENGAGKSTLIKALTGVYGIDAGTITVLGEQTTFTGPADSQAAGISTVYQEVNLVTNLSVAENLLLGHEPRSGGRIDWSAMSSKARAILQGLNLDIDPRSTLGTHSIAVQQLVAIGRAVDLDCRVLVLDEPTSSLDADEVEELFRVMRDLRAQGVAILFVSHFLDQVYEVSDRLTVLRNGALVGEHLVSDLPKGDLIRLMIGRELDTLEALDDAVDASAPPRSTTAQPVLTVVGVGRRNTLEETDLELFEGEVVGLAGLLGSGRTELARLIYGADRSDTGDVRVSRQDRSVSHPRGALTSKIAFSSEDRKHEGIIDDLSVRDNIALAVQAGRGWMRPIPRAELDALAADYIERLNIRPPDPDALIRNLSGGNQQKVLLARWLATSPEILILDEPTRGIDIGAKTEIQKLVTTLANDGMSVVFISAELEEVLRISHRVVVMKDRRKIAEMPNRDLTVDDVLDVIAAGGVS